MAVGAVDVLTDNLAAPAGLTWFNMNRGLRRAFLVARAPDFLVVGFDVSQRPDLTDPDPPGPPATNGRGR